MRRLSPWRALRQGCLSALRRGASACSHVLVKAPLSRLAKTAVVTLCVALSVVFAGASASSLIDKLQHQGPSAHAHAHIVFSVALEDHHADGDLDHHGDHADDVASVQAPDVAPDHLPGAGHHHHTDSPAGFVATGAPLAALTAQSSERLAARSDHLIRSPGSPGPERPPKSLTTSA